VGVPRPPHAHKSDVAFTSVLGRCCVAEGVPVAGELPGSADSPAAVACDLRVAPPAHRAFRARRGPALLARAGSGEGGHRRAAVLGTGAAGCRVRSAGQAAGWRLQGDVVVCSRGERRAGGGRLCGGSCGGGRYVFFAGYAELLLQGNGYGEDRRSCEVSCVVVTDGGGRNVLIFCESMHAGNVWRVDGVQLN
jgi:hypothetical protein